VPYRIELAGAAGEAFDRLVELGALDADMAPGDTLVAVMPDCVPPRAVADALGLAEVHVLPAVGRDSQSVWVLGPRAVSIGQVRIVPAGAAGGATTAGATVRLVDSLAFGTGLHPTTALCLQALQEVVEIARPDAVLDVGTGSGILALAALALGVPRALGIDIDEAALSAAAENVRVNAAGDRLRLALGGPETVPGLWPLVLANVLPAPLIEMAPALAMRMGHQGQLVLSGIRTSVEQDVSRACVRQGLRRVRALSRDGWVALILQASW
jgi:ribosomal protein L11 methyltransferase